MTPRDTAAHVLAEHDDPPGWVWTDDEAMAYECSCGDRSPTLSRDFITNEDTEAAAEWHRAHVAERLDAAGVLAPDDVIEAVADAWGKGRGDWHRLLMSIDERIERLEEVAERWDVPGGSKRLALRAHDKADGLRVARALVARHRGGDGGGSS